MERIPVVNSSQAETEPVNDIIIKPISEDAWEDYRNLRHEMLTYDPKAFPEQAYADFDDPEEKWRERIKTSDVILAYDKDRAIGMIRVTYDEKVAMLRNMYTNADYRGQGLGKKLMAAAMDAITSRPVAVIRLEVEDTQIPARTMYKKFGFQEVGAVPNERGGFMITMEKVLVEE